MSVSISYQKLTICFYGLAVKVSKIDKVRTNDSMFRSSHPEVLLGKGVLKICSKFTGKHSCQSAISIKLQSKFIEITLWHGYSPVNLLHIFRLLFTENTSGQLHLSIYNYINSSCRKQTSEKKKIIII